jgi:hypothetical protein
LVQELVDPEQPIAVGFDDINRLIELRQRKLIPSMPRLKPSRPCRHAASRRRSMTSPSTGPFLPLATATG